METVSEEPVRNSRIIAVLVFMMHQVIATWCVVYSVAPLAVAIFVTWAHLFGRTITSHQSSAILSGTPYFPVQIGLALFLGWSLGGWLQHRSMLWVWVIPSVIMGIVVAAFPWIGQIAIKQYWYLSSPSRLSHFFGWGCRPENRCLDQFFTTLPFYSAAAYSLGAHVARVKMEALSSYAEVMNDIKVPRAFLPGLCYTCFDLITGWRTMVHIVVRWGWGWFSIAFVWAFAVEFTFVTYVFMVVISLIGRRFFLTRWFLNQNSKAGEGEMSQLPSDS